MDARLFAEKINVSWLEELTPKALESALDDAKRGECKKLGDGAKALVEYLIGL